MYPVIRLVTEFIRFRRAPALPLTGTHVSRHMCLPWDIDLWMELNNGRTLTLYDLGRLPLAKRGPLVSLSVEDHYVRIRTRQGEEMVLMRLADAVRETRGVVGLQVHRSHWVALDQVRGAARRGDGAVLTMSTGPDIPVSRANVAAIRDAGLLPR